MSEEVAAPAADPGAPATTEAAPEAPPPVDAAPPAPEPAPEAPKTAEFQALARARGKLLKIEQATKQRETALESRAAEIEARASKVAPLVDAMEKFEDDPEGFLTAFAKAKGVETQHFFNTLVTKLAHKGEPPDPNDRVAKLEEQIAAKEAAAAKAREDAEKQQAEAARAEGRKQIEAYLLADTEKHERVAKRLATEDGKAEVHNHLMQMAEWYKNKGEELSLDTAAQNLESWFESQDRDLLRELLGSKKLAPPEPQPTNASATPTNPAAAPTPAEQAAPTPPPAPKSLPKTIPTGRATVPAAGRRAVQRSVSNEAAEDMKRWAAALAGKR
jgi:hypothetical protein